MTITRRWQSGLEVLGLASMQSEFSGWDWVAGGDWPHVSGDFGLGLGVGSMARVTIPATRQFRTAFHALIGHCTWGSRVLFYLNNVTTTLMLKPEANTNEETWGFYIGGVQAATFALHTPFSGWMHIGIDVKVDSSAGWFYVYVDGLPVVQFDGDTGNFDVTSVNYSGAADNFESDNRDDMYIDDTTGELAPAVCPDRRWLPMVANADGTYLQGTRSNDQVAHYTLLDDRAHIGPGDNGGNHDSDATYVYMEEAGLRESVNLNLPTLPVNFVPMAFIAYAVWRKTDAEVDSKGVLFHRSGETDVDEPAVSLPTSYQLAQKRYPLDPNGDPWTLETLAGVEVGVQSAGSY